MAFNFRCADRDQFFLMPPSIAEWLPEGHLAWAILAVMGALDLGGFEETYRRDGRGGAAYDPAMMVALVLYAYCVGERSSRRIERRCVEDVAFRVVAANDKPDHTTIARFVARHDEALAALFTQVLELCARAGMVEVGVVAIDGTKLAADAAGSANRSLGDVARQIIREALVTDVTEDAGFGDARGDEVPAVLSNLEWVGEAVAEIEARRRRSIKRRPTAQRNEPKVNLTDPDSRIMKTPQGFVQGYNAQAAVSADQVIVAAELTQDPVDTDQLIPMIQAAGSNLGQAGLSVRTVVADAGYWSPDNALADVGPELLIATTKTASQTSNVVDPSMLETTLQAVLDRSMTHREAACQLGMPKTNLTRMVGAFRNDPRRALAREFMAAKLAESAHHATYVTRSTTVEPVFGQIKSARGIRRFRRRGHQACAAEWKLIATTHNLLKWWRKVPPPTPLPA